MIFENFEIALDLLGQFQTFRKCTQAIYPLLPPKHVITSINKMKNNDYNQNKINHDMLLHFSIFKKHEKVHWF